MNVPVARRNCNMAKKTKGVPTNLAFARHIQPSDGCMYRTRWENRTSLEPLRLGTKTMRTVLSNRVKKDDGEKNDGKTLKKQNEGDWQIHSVDYCTLGPDYDTLAVKFTVKFLGGLGNPYCCNDAAYCLGLKEKVDEYVKNSNDFYGLGDLALRYRRLYGLRTGFRRKAHLCRGGLRAQRDHLVCHHSA